ncbi:MAG: homoprotocatechuate degradation operon regulator HpaR [Rhodopseudomonas sp.]|nr:homoprotocatechuate degradation operon regulator HpaR [Rhodopseudomonas sp.]
MTANVRKRSGDDNNLLRETPLLPLREFSRSLPMALLKAREAVMSYFRPSLHYFGVTEQQWRVLRALMSVEAMEVMALAQAAFLLPPSLSRILKDLDERDLIVRRASEQDMRRGLVSISERGRELVNGVGVNSEAIYAEISKRYGAEKLALLQDMLSDLEQALREPLGATPLVLPAKGIAPDKRESRPRRGRPPKSAGKIP